MALNSGQLRSYLVQKLIAHRGKEISLEAQTYGSLQRPPTMYLIGSPTINPLGYRQWYEIHIDELHAVIWQKVVGGAVVATADPALKTEIVAAMAGDVILGPWLNDNL